MKNKFYIGIRECNEGPYHQLWGVSVRSTTVLNRSHTIACTVTKPLRSEVSLHLLLSGLVIDCPTEHPILPELIYY
jgi:hypothetical protein